MPTDNNIKIPESTEIKIQPLPHAVFSGDGAQSVTYTQGKGYYFTTDDIPTDESVIEKAVKEKLNAIYGARIEEKHEEEEWIWVDGYKGMSSDMTAYGAFKYELNKMYAMPEDAEIKECESGFHLCLDLADVFGYVNIGGGNRFFKVRALVRKKDVTNYERRKHSPSYTFLYGRYDKLAAKQILIERELNPSEILYQDKYADWTPYEMNLALEKGVPEAKSYHAFYKLVEAGYSETFAKYVSKDTDRTERALAAASMPTLSMDMKVFMIMYEPED